jgi:kelch-like protein 1/4/5
MIKEDIECQELIKDAFKYHSLPDRRSALQSPRTKPRKSTVGMLYAVGGMDNNKGTNIVIILHQYIFLAFLLDQNFYFY